VALDLKDFKGQQEDLGHQACRANLEIPERLDSRVHKGREGSLD
jgi:hypothetical protein